MTLKHSLQPYLNFAIETAVEAGKFTLGYYQTTLQVDTKNDGTPVTQADRKAEAFIRRQIEQKYPGHAIVGEEYGSEGAENAGFRWFVDPIDGTRSFMRGVPLYSVLIGLEIEGNVEVGVAYFPALNELLAAGTDLGCWWNGRPAHVSRTSRVDEAVVAFTDVVNFERYNRRKEWERVMAATHYRAGWGDAFGYLLVATGRADIMLEAVVNVWDVAVYPPILREAGGYFGDWSGNPTIHHQEGLATNPALLPKILELINEE
ncbi:MAG: inositol monophosphatase family protein [Anaerolineaceae bacterium]|nr:inositol monophosphatase family protein [Anaerolineaceae bacterium]